jgi:hypothetical protein
MSNTLTFKKSDVHGFPVFRFTDLYGEKCSVQESSLATQSAIWLGIDDARPLVMASDAKRNGVKTEQTEGWVPYPIPEDVLLHTRMHLTREQVKSLLPMLVFFAETGSLPEFP